MGNQGDACSSNCGKKLQLGRKLVAGTKCKQGGNRNTNESMQAVPDHVECGNFVSNKLNHKHEPAYADHPPVRQHIKTHWQLNPVGPSQQAQREQRGIHIQSRGKAGCNDQSGDGSGRKRVHKRLLMLTTCRVLLAIHYNPAVVCSVVGGTVNVVNACRETASCWEKCLSVCIYLRVDGRGHNTVELIIAHYLDQARIAIGKCYAQWKNLMAAVRSSALRARRAHRNSADHYIVRGVFLVRVEQACELLVYLRRTALRHGNVVLSICYDRTE